MFNPFRNRDGFEIIFIQANDHAVNSGVDNLTLAHGTGGCVFDVFSCFAINPNQVQRRTDHVIACGTDDGIGFRVYRAADLVSLSARNFQFDPDAPAEVDTILPSARRAVVSRGNHLIVIDDNGAEIAA